MQLHELLTAITSEIQLQEIHTQQHLSMAEQTIITQYTEATKIQVNHVTTFPQQYSLEKLIKRLCEAMLEVIPTSTEPQAKVEGLVTALQASQTEVQVFKAEFELHLAS